MREILQDQLDPTDAGRSLPEVQSLAELEFALAQQTKASVSVLRIAIDALERLAPTLERQVVLQRAVVGLLRALPRAGDLLAFVDEHDIVVLLPHTPPEAAELVCRLLIDSARKLALQGEPKPLRVSLSIGLAYTQPALELYFETLMRVAEEGVTVASASGSESFVHTELYGLHQRKLERERPSPGPQPSPAAVAAYAAHLPAGSNGHAAHPGVAQAINHAAPAPMVNVPAPDAAFETSVRAAVRGEVSAQPSFESLEGKVLALARDWAQQALNKALATHVTEHAAEIDLLQRRIVKLQRSLEEAESELRELAHRQHIDPGVASAYRYVQGLSDSEAHYAAKLDLLSKILEQNLVLQNRLGRAS